MNGTGPSSVKNCRGNGWSSLAALTFLALAACATPVDETLDSSGDRLPTGGSAPVIGDGGSGSGGSGSAGSGSGGSGSAGSGSAGGGTSGGGSVSSGGGSSAGGGSGGSGSGSGGEDASGGADAAGGSGGSESGAGGDGWTDTGGSSGNTGGTTSGTGGGGDPGDCINLALNTESAPFGTTGPKCFIVDSQPPNSWAVHHGAGRTVTINGTSAMPGQLPFPGSAPFLVEFSAGDLDYTVWSYW